MHSRVHHLLRALALSLLLAISSRAGNVIAEEGECSRIVSLAPSITELLFDLELGPAVVGVTRFCRYPKEAKGIRNVGGMYDLSLERVVAERPTSVFSLQENSSALLPLQRFGIPVSLMEHRNIAGIIESYRIVGKRCAIESRAEERIRALKSAEAEVATRCRAARGGSAPLRVMVVVGRAGTARQGAPVYISGSDGFYSDLLKLLGADNVQSGTTVAVPTISHEGILALNPDVILEVVNSDDGDSMEQVESRMDFWKGFEGVPAVRHNKVFILRDDFASIPGPRYILLARRLSDLLCGA